MEQFLQMLDLQFSVLVYLLIGVFAYKTKIINDENRTHFIHLILSILMPMLVFNSFKSLTLEILELGLWALIGSTIIYTVSYFVGAMAFTDFEDRKKRILHYGTLVNNAGLGGQPLSYSMYGEIGALFASIYLVPHRIFMWSVGVTILDSDKEESHSVIYKLLRNPSIIAVILGLLRSLLQIQLPKFLDRAIAAMGSTVSPLAAIMIGSIIASIDFRAIYERGVIRYTVIRLLLIPFAVLIVSKALGLDETLIG
ncbi:MAG TPA: AEC family transporter, partial [Enterococcus sp.]|nr:AEC family transporter [Enterococcus sp.]